MSMLDAVANQASHGVAVTAATATSLVGSTSLALGAIPMAAPPDGTPWYIPWLMTMAGPAVTLVCGRLLAAYAAKKRAKAKADRRKAEALLTDADKDNDAKAEALHDEADTLEAEADSLEALKGPKEK